MEKILPPEQSEKNRSSYNLAIFFFESILKMTEEQGGKEVEALKSLGLPKHQLKWIKIFISNMSAK